MFLSHIGIFLSLSLSPSFLPSLPSFLSKINKHIYVFNVKIKAYEKFISMVSDSTLQLTFKKNVRFWCSTKEKYPQLFGKGINILLPFPTTYLCEVRFHSCTSTKTCHDSFRTDLRIQFFLFQVLFCFFILTQGHFFIAFREKERGRERNIDWLLTSCRLPNWGSNLQPFGVWDLAPTI